MRLLLRQQSLIKLAKCKRRGGQQLWTQWLGGGATGLVWRGRTAGGRALLLLQLGGRGRQAHKGGGGARGAWPPLLLLSLLLLMPGARACMKEACWRAPGESASRGWAHAPPLKASQGW